MFGSKTNRSASRFALGRMRIGLAAAGGQLIGEIQVLTANSGSATRVPTTEPVAEPALPSPYATIRTGSAE